MADFFIHPIESPLKSVAGVWKFERPALKNSKAKSTPGHLIHFIKKGNLKVKVADGEYSLEPGDAFHYFDSEEVTSSSSGKTIFYSVSFRAPDLPPLSAESRKIKTEKNLEKEFENLYEASLMPESPLKNLALHTLLSKIILEIDRKNQWLKEKRNSKWGELENEIRKRKKFRTSLQELSKLAKQSKAGLVRLCRKATGKTPMQRIREIRMAEAENLLKHTHMNVSQTADYLGYARIHEFSREFSKFFGYPPGKIKRENL
jgi:AraC-like DNA-binding protein